MSFKETVEKFFKEIDTDGSGKISVAELKKVLEAECGKSVKEEDVKAFMVKFDVNQDGELSIDELAALF